MQLSRKRIVAAGMALIETDGVEAVSMARLATELGCGVIALYNHVPSRRALLDGIADAVISGIAETPQAGADWADQLRAQATAFRQAALKHPRSAMVALSMAAPSRQAVPPSMTRPAETTLATLREAGFSGPDAVKAGRALAAYLAGWLLREVGVAPGLTDSGDGQDAAPRLQPAQFPHLTELGPELRASDPDGDFEFGLDLLIRAIASMPRSPRGGKPSTSESGNSELCNSEPGRC
jgi:AcrR family transcriptional regulator